MMLIFNYVLIQVAQLGIQYENLYIALASITQSFEPLVHINNKICYNFRAELSQGQNLEETLIIWMC